ncbi:hypothetical protein GBA52_014707 [Prunus armeniaca]|nr:hypothetical protein GBA52_014707 [Prunus armeniaca]
MTSTPSSSSSFLWATTAVAAWSEALAAATATAPIGCRSRWLLLPVAFSRRANESTANAYKKQFQTDLASFLRSRAKELKKGGSMFLGLFGRTSVDPTEQSGLGLLLGTPHSGKSD